MTTRARLLFETVRRLQPGQIASRASRVLRGRWASLRGARVRLPAGVAAAPHAPLFPDRARHASAPPPAAEPDWHDASIPRLQRFHLHYFDYATVAGAAAFRQWARSWMRENERLRGDGWHPYTISRRVVNWLRAADEFSDELDPAFRQELSASTYAQLRFLARNLERDVRGNHLIANLRALVCGAACFAGAEPRRWRETALRLLETEVGEQILPDGGHFERNPGYHLVVLRDLDDVARWLGSDAPPWLHDAIARMIAFRDAILTPAGTPPLLKDTTLDDVPPIAAPSAEGVAFLRDSGFVVLRDRGDYAIVDVGKPCPEYLPAHAHADLFSFELWLGGAPFVVDAGVFTYEAGEWRDFFRSTRAHNTVEVGGENQTEVWAAFRAARRAMPSGVAVTPESGAVVIEGSHDGYRRLRVPVTHHRRFVWSPEELRIVDDLAGRGSTTAASRIHFAPGISVERRGESFWIAGGVGIRAFGHDTAAIESGWRSERFGEKVPAAVLTLRVDGALPRTFGYAIARRR
jgi:uncharacterized heparinase superfamily protein